MPFELKIAIRYLFSKHGGARRFTSLAAVLGITVGVACLIIAQAVAKGFSDEIRSKVLSNTSHIIIFDNGKMRISNWKIVKEKVERVKNVAAVEPTSYKSAVVSSKENSSYGILKLESERRKTKNKIDSTSGRAPNSLTENYPKISLGKELADKLGLKNHDKAKLITIGTNKIPVNSEVIINGIFETGLYEYDSTWIYASRKNYKKITGSRELSPFVFDISVRDIFQASETAEKIRKVLGDNFKVISWREANKTLFAVLSLERKATLTIISLIIFIAALNIITMLTLLINERRLDIAVLRTCGAKLRSLVMIFLLEGLILSSIGIVSGLFIGLSACFIGNYFKLIKISKEVYLLNYIPFHADFWEVLMIILISFMLCLSAASYPALRVSKVKPLENLNA